jgi:hypothetical protein
MKQTSETMELVGGKWEYKKGGEEASDRAKWALAIDAVSFEWELNEILERPAGDGDRLIPSDGDLSEACREVRGGVDDEIFSAIQKWELPEWSNVVQEKIEAKKTELIAEFEKDANKWNFWAYAISWIITDRLIRCIPNFDQLCTDIRFEDDNVVKLYDAQFNLIQELSVYSFYEMYFSVKDEQPTWMDK